MKVFVYGTLKQGFGNSGLLNRASYLGNAYIKGNMYSLGVFPAVSLDGNYRILGEVYRIDEEILSELDRLEGFPWFYHRSLVRTTDDELVWVYHIETLKAKREVEVIIDDIKCW